MVKQTHGEPAEVAPAADPGEERLRRTLALNLDEGFADVVATHGDVVYSVARNLTRHSADAEDLASETLLRAYRALRSYDTARIATLSIRPWLLTILRNTARNAIRDAARRPGRPPKFEPTADRASPDPAAGPAQRAEQAYTQRLLGAVLGDLPEAQRNAVVLRHVAGLPIHEIAEVLGCKDGTVKSHISRGLQRLRVLLTDTTGPTHGPADSTLSAGAAFVAVDRTAQRVLGSGRKRS